MPFILSFYGIHCGKVPEKILLADSVHHFENHLVLRIGQESASPFIIRYLKFESKSTPLKEIALHTIFLGKEVLFSENGQQKSFGYIAKIKLADDCSRYIIKTVDENRQASHTIFCPKNKTETGCTYRVEQDQSRHEALKASITISSKDYDHPQYEQEKSVNGSLIELKFTKKDDGRCILGVQVSAIESVPEAYKALIKSFETAIKTKEYTIQDMTNGETNQPILKQNLELTELKGHTGKSAKHNPRSSAHDVKLYLGNVDRLVYRYEGRYLVYDEVLSAEAGH